MTPETESGRTLAQSLTNDDRGISAGGGISIIVAVIVGAIMVAYLLPDALSEMASASTTGWGDGAGSLYEILPLMIVLAVFLFFVGLAVYAVRKV